MPTLPTPDATKDVWGAQLNSFLDVAHNSDGTIGIHQGESMPPGDAVTQGKQLTVTQGYYSSSQPDTGVVPPVKISRYISHSNLAGDFTGDGNENFAALSATAQGAASATNGVQPVGVFGSATNQGSQARSGGGFLSPDAVGVYGMGTISGGGTGLACGVFAYGVRASDAPSGYYITAIQATASNSTGDTHWDGVNVNDTVLFIGNNGPDKIASGAVIGSPTGSPTLDVGVGFLQSIVSAAIRDDSTAASSIILNGTHTGYGIDLKGGTFTSGAIRLANGQSIMARNAAGSADISLFKLDGSNLLEIGANAYFTTNAIFAASIQVNDSAEFLLGTTTGTQFGTATNQKLSFYGATPIVQPNTVGTSTGYTAGSTTGTFHTDDKYTGNVGTTAYTVNGIVAALKNLGLIAS